MKSCHFIGIGLKNPVDFVDMFIDADGSVDGYIDMPTALLFSYVCSVSFCFWKKENGVILEVPIMVATCYSAYTTISHHWSYPVKYVASILFFSVCFFCQETGNCHYLP